MEASTVTLALNCNVRRVLFGVLMKRQAVFLGCTSMLCTHVAIVVRFWLRSVPVNWLSRH